MAIDEARALVADQSLWPLIRDFLWDFAPQVHGSWLEGVFPPAGCDRLQSTAIDSPRVRRFILDSLDVRPCFHTFPKDDWSRLLLLDGPTLLEIAKWLGALACADSLRRVTSGKTVRELKSALPGVYPEVFGYTMYFKSKVESQTSKVAELGPDYVVQVGVALLQSFVQGLSDALRHRLSLKLPKQFCNSSDSRPSTFDLRPSDFKPSSLQLLLKLRFPEAYSLCC